MIKAAGRKTELIDFVVNRVRQELAAATVAAAALEHRGLVA